MEFLDEARESRTIKTITLDNSRKWAAGGPTASFVRIQVVSGLSMEEEIALERFTRVKL